MLIKEVKPIKKFGKNLKENKEKIDIIDRIIELPLRKACKIFRSKNIETNMSSSNRNNLPKNGKRVEKKDLKIDGKIHYLKPNLYDAGKGYTWIMINYDTLSNENKEKIFELQNKLDEENIWLVYCMCYTKPDSDQPDYTEYKKRFDEKSFKLIYNKRYPRRTIFVRMPLSNETTVEEVEEFYTKFANEMLAQ